jgi:hypothetical protein
LSAHACRIFPHILTTLTLGHIVAEVTLDTIVSIGTGVSFIISFLALVDVIGRDV